MNSLPYLSEGRGPFNKDPPTCGLSEQREAVQSNHESCQGLVRRQSTGIDKTQKKKHSWPLLSENNIQSLAREEMQLIKKHHFFFRPIQITKIVLTMTPRRWYGCEDTGAHKHSQKPLGQCTLLQAFRRRRHFYLFFDLIIPFLRLYPKKTIKKQTKRFKVFKYQYYF